MKGTVVSTWIETMEKLHSKELVDEAKKESDWNEEVVITPLMNIEDNKAFDLIEKVALKANQNTEDLWFQIGKQNIYSFADWFPSYFKGRQLKNFLMLMDTVHKQLTNMISGANPPRIIPEELSTDTIQLTYKSKRGMYDYFLGLLNGSAEFFEEDMEITEIERGKEDEKHYLIVRIKFAKDFKEVKNYTFNKLLSFGFLKKIKYKLAFSLIIVNLLVIYLFKINNPLILTAINGGAGFFFSHFLTKPFKTLENELNKMKDLNLDNAISLNTNDEFESTFSKLKEVKIKIREDILFLKGGTDDMYNFTEEIVDISDEMGKVSENISTVVNEVAQGAQEQAEETENSAYIVDNNINTIEELAESGEKSKEELETAVNSIKESASEVEKVNNRIENVKEAFADVNERGKELAQEISEIMEIVDTVSEIANQTNLLSLNASIEAARLGQEGAGFSVVANEIRTLADNSKESIENIDDILNEMRDKMDQILEIANDTSQITEEQATAIESLTENIIEIQEFIEIWLEK